MDACTEYFIQLNDMIKLFFDAEHLLHFSYHVAISMNWKELSP